MCGRGPSLLRRAAKESRPPFTAYRFPSVPFRRMACARFHDSFEFQEPSNQLPPFATGGAFGLSSGSREPRRGSSRFSPPDGYPLSQAGISTLLRIHLPPHTASIRLESPLEFHDPLWPSRAERYEASPVTDGFL